uniref:NR LBD domain-containing protein n=1 Tax=Caenorhabditis japonica TaxID=281687 RepID=A0A8R1DZG1_CAEJA
MPLGLANFLGRPAFILSCEPDRATRVNTFIDVTFLIHRATDIMSVAESETRRFAAQDSLHRMTRKFCELRKEKDQLKVVKVLGLKESMFFWEQDFLATATWLTHFDELQQLPLNVKMQILKVGWVLWGRLEKLAKTADYRRKKQFGSDCFMIGDDACLDIQDFEVDISWCTNYTKEQLV